MLASCKVGPCCALLAAVRFQTHTPRAVLPRCDSNKERTIDDSLFCDFKVSMKCRSAEGTTYRVGLD